jgi:hypothetical protein
MIIARTAVIFAVITGRCRRNTPKCCQKILKTKKYGQTRKRHCSGHSRFIRKCQEIQKQPGLHQSTESAGAIQRLLSIQPPTHVRTEARFSNAIAKRKMGEAISSQNQK